MGLAFIIVAGCSGTGLSKESRNAVGSLPFNEQKGNDFFPPVIQAAIRESLRDPNSTLDSEDLIKVESIYLQGVSEITDLSSLMRLDNLESLDLSHVKVQSYEFLYQLPRLTSLSIEGASVHELPDFNRLNLQSLLISDSDIASLDFMTKWDTLENFSLEHSQLHSLDGIHKGVNLKTLKVSYNPVSDIRMLKGLDQLQRLEIRNTKVENIADLKGCKELMLLDIRDTPVTSIAAAASLPQLKVLLVSKDNIKDLEKVPATVQVSEANVLAY